MNWNLSSLNKKQEQMLIQKLDNSSFFVAWHLVDQSLLFSFNLLKTVEFNVVSIKLGFLFVEVIIQLHHFLLSVFSLRLALVPFSQGSKFLLLDLNGEFVHAFVERIHNFIKGDDFSDEFHGQTFQLVWFTVLLGLQDSDVVIFVKSDRWSGCHVFWVRMQKEFKCLGL